MFSIQFNFNPETSKITNLKVQKINPLDDLPIISIENNKLSISEAAMSLLGVSVGDRLTVNYWTQSNTETFPVVGRSELFTDKTGGNKITKSNSVLFRGLQKDVLQEYGTIFKLEPFKDFFKMVSIESTNDSEK